MRISKPRRREAGDVSHLAASIEYHGGKRELWFSVPRQWAYGFTEDRCDGFVVALLLQAMEMGEDIRVDGALSSRLYHNIVNTFIPVVVEAFPRLRAIRLHPSELVDVRSFGSHVATGFSAGIDSFASFITHHINETSDTHKVSLLLFNNVGSHGSFSCGEERGRKLFQQRQKLVIPFAEEVSLPFLAVDSNIACIFATDFIKMHSALNCSVPLILQNLIGRFYYASTYKYADCGFGSVQDIGKLDPFIIHALSTESLECLSSGCRFSRVQKTQLVAKYEPSYRLLNVCVDPAFEGRNCSVCFKCCRTQLTLELLGLEEMYHKVFDFKKFETVRTAYIFRVLLYKSNSFEAEIAALAIQKNAGWSSKVLWLRSKMAGMLP